MPTPLPWWVYVTAAVVGTLVALWVVVGEFAKRLPKPPHEEDPNSKFE